MDRSNRLPAKSTDSMQIAHSTFGRGSAACLYGCTCFFLEEAAILPSPPPPPTAAVAVVAAVAVAGVIEDEEDEGVLEVDESGARREEVMSPSSNSIDLSLFDRTLLFGELPTTPPPAAASISPSEEAEEAEEDRRRWI